MHERPQASKERDEERGGICAPGPAVSFFRECFPSFGQPILIFGKTEPVNRISPYSAIVPWPAT